MKMKKKIVALSLFLIIGLIILLDISGDYKEVFVMQDIKVKVFFSEKYDTIKKCVILTDDSSYYRKNNFFILGLKFRNKYLSIKHEFIWNTFMNHRPEGYRGNIDSIRNIGISLISDNSIIESSQIKSAEGFKYFNFAKSIINKSELGSYGTSAEIFHSLDDFIEFYNSKNYKVGTIGNYLFFKVDSIDFKKLGNGVNIRIDFTNGKIISSSSTSVGASDNDK